MMIVELGWLEMLLHSLKGASSPSGSARVWLARECLKRPRLAPFLDDPLLTYQGEFLSLDRQQLALETAWESRDDQSGAVGLLWGALYFPAMQKAVAARIAVAELPLETPESWFLLEPLEPMPECVQASAQKGLIEALRLIEQAGLPPPRPCRLLYQVEHVAQVTGDSLGLPLFLALLSVLLQVPLRPRLGATGAVEEGVLRPVGWVTEKRAALEAHGIVLLSPESCSDLAGAAQQALDGGPALTPQGRAVSPLVPAPTFLVADVALELSDQQVAQVAAFESSVCAALVRCSGFLYRERAGVEEGIRAAFATVESACAAALALQQALLRRPWPEQNAPLLARVGIAQGEAERIAEGYRSEAARLAVRLMQAAQPGQILVPMELLAGQTYDYTSLGTHRLRDLSTRLTLAQLESPEVPRCTLAPRTLPARQHNLPLELNPLLGRELERASIRAFFEAGRRLVTLTGPGGVGKTRLALQVAAELVGSFPDGVWFVALADVSGEEQFLAAIGDALGLAIREKSVNLLETLAQRKILLVLDNFETVLSCAPKLASILRQSPDLVCLVTSQVLLDIQGEWRFDVGALPLPEAMELFIERAHQAQPALQFNEAEMLCISRICRRLEQMPLAVELAAVRVRIFSIEEIEVHLDDALSLLATRTRDIPARHRTMRAALDWSFSLLDEIERRYFLRMSVFPGSFLPAAAESVCDEPRIVEWLQLLEEKSLVRRDDTGRWRMLHLVHLFAQEKLRENSHEENRAQEGLIKYAQSIIEHAYVNSDSYAEKDAYEKTDADFEIVRQGMDLLREKRNIDFVSGLIKFHVYLRKRRYLKELQAWAEFSLENIHDVDLISKGHLYMMLAYCFREKNDPKTIEYYDIALEIGRQIDDRSLIVDSMSNKGIFIVRSNEISTALELYHEAMNICKSIGDELLYVRLLNNMAQAKIKEEKYDEVDEILIESEKICRDKGYTRDLIVCLSTRGWKDFCIMNYGKVIADAMSVIDICIELKDVMPFVKTLNNLYIAESSLGSVNYKVFMMCCDIYDDVGDVDGGRVVRKTLRDRYGIFQWEKYCYGVRYDLRDLKGTFAAIQELANGAT